MTTTSFEFLSNFDPSIFNSFNPDPTVRHSWLSILIGSSTTYLTLYAVNQAQVQRLLTVKDLKSAQLAVWISWPILSVLSLSTCFCGLVIYYYYRNCDPLEQGRIESRDQNMPLYVIDGKIFLFKNVQNFIC